MTTHRKITEETRAELLSNPYTERVTDSRVIFSLAFKEFIVANMDKPGMNSTSLFEAAGYRRELFDSKFRQQTVLRIRREAASEGGLKDTALKKPKTPRKKHSETEFRELQDRVALLEQQIDFLKKSQFLRRGNHSVPGISSD